MPTLSTSKDNQIIVRRGETIPIYISVYDNAGALVTNITSAKLAYTGDGMTIPIVRDCTFQDGVVSYIFTQAETLALVNATYKYEVKIKTNLSLVDSVLSGTIIVKNSLITSVM